MVGGVKVYYAVLLALVMGVGCDGSNEKAAPKSQAKTDATPKTEPKVEAKKPLTKEESAKVIEAAIRKAARKPTGELTKADLEKVTWLDLNYKQLTSVKGLENLTQLTVLYLNDNPNLTKAQIGELQKAFPNCTIISNPTKQPPNGPAVAVVAL